MLPITAFSQKPTSLRFDKLDTESGLPNEMVTGIVQDNLGFMWFGTSNGLARFDGHRVKVWKTVAGDPGSLRDNAINRLFKDRSGILWIATSGGAQRFDAASQRFLVSPATKQIPGTINAFADDGAGGVWIGTDDGLFHVNSSGTSAKAQFPALGRTGQVGRSGVMSISMAPDRTLWLGTEAGVEHYDPITGSFQNYPVQTDRGSMVRHLLIDGDTLWLGSRTGLQRWDISKREPVRSVFTSREGLPISSAQFLMIDSAKRIWVGTGSRGLYRSDLEKRDFQAFEHDATDPSSLGDNRILTMYQDKSGSIWVGTVGGGVSWADLEGGGFMRIRQSPGKTGGISSNMVSSILDADPGKLWIGTLYGGLNLYDLQTGHATAFMPMPHDTHSLSYAMVTGLAHDNDRRLWVATWRGLNLWDAERQNFERYYFGYEDGKPNALNCVVRGANGQLWVGSNHGLHLFDPYGRTHRTYLNETQGEMGSRSDIILGIFPSSSGQLWLRTPVGVTRFDPSTEQFSQMPPSSSPYKDGYGTVNVIGADKAENIWLGTSTGIHRVRLDRTGVPVVEFNLRSYGVNAMLFAPDGKIWMSTSNGVVAFDPKTGNEQQYGARDGVTTGSFFDGAAFQDKEGRMYFGSNATGITIFNPSHVRPNLHVPAIALTDFQIFNQSTIDALAPAGYALARSLNDDGEVQLEYQHSVFSIEFSALHFANPRGNIYAHMLEGVDRDWVQSDASKRFVTYTNLSPGRYKFRVKAASINQVWNQEGRTLSIVIHPPFWKTWWFTLASVSGAAFAAYYLVRRRLQQYVVQQQALELQVRERTRSVETAMTQLKYTQQQMVLQEKMASLGTLTAGIAHEINNPVNFAHAGTQTLNGMIDDFADFLRELAGGASADPEIVDALNKRTSGLSTQLSIISDGTSRIRHLVKDLLTFSRLGEAERKSVVIAENIVSTANLVRGQYDGVVHIDCDLTVDTAIECWPSLLNQVFLNLMINACHSAAAAHSVMPRAGQLVIRDKIIDGRLFLEFEDNGLGISSQVMDHIFEPFFTTKPIGEGTGLGLSICFGIVQKHGGEITVSSAPGKGACFTIQLPLRPET